MNNFGSNNTTFGMSGGGTGLYGKGSNGTGGGNGQHGTGGSGGNKGTDTRGGAYGAGGGGCGLDSDQGKARGAAGAHGAIRIIWGTGKSFPTNCT